VAAVRALNFERWLQVPDIDSKKIGKLVQIMIVRIIGSKKYYEINTQIVYTNSEF